MAGPSKKKAPTAAPKAPSPYQSEKHLRQFVEATSRELGNVLGTIVGELDYATATTDPSVRDRAMRIALAAAERSRSLARNLSYFSTHTQLNTEQTDLSQVLIDTVDVVEKELETKQIHVNVFAEASTFMDVDGGAIQQVLLNLLDNAAQAMPHGGKITLTLRQLESNVEIRCADTGVGIPEQHMEQVFEPYLSRGKNENQGLGLSVAKALIEAHNGEIFVQSRVHEGTTFTILLPSGEPVTKPPPFRTQRNHRRVRTKLPAELHMGNHANIEAETFILSLGGCFLRVFDTEAFQLPEVNSVISIKIFYFKQEILEIPKCRIASVNWSGNVRGLGLEFQALDEKSRRIITAIVQSHTK